MKVHFFRHGITIANEQMLYYGATDISLSQRGVDELKRLKNETVLPDADFFATSGLRRTKETLRLLYDKEPNLKIPELNEFNFGDFEMKNYDQLRDDPGFIRWLSGGDDAMCPGGESNNQFAHRVKRGLKIVKEIKAENVAIVTHGGVIGILMQMLFPQVHMNYYSWVPDCGHGYTVNFGDDAMTHTPIE